MWTIKINTTLFQGSWPCTFFVFNQQSQQGCVSVQNNSKNVFHAEKIKIIVFIRCCVENIPKQGATP